MQFGRVPASGGELVYAFEVEVESEASGAFLATPGGLDAYILNGTFTFVRPDLLGDGTDLAGRLADDTIGALTGAAAGDAPALFRDRFGEVTTLSPGVQYFLVIDGFNGSEGPFLFDFTLDGGPLERCDDGSGLMIDGDLTQLFGNGGPLMAADPLAVSGDNGGKPNGLCNYGTPPLVSLFGGTQSGGELIYAFEVAEPFVPTAFVTSSNTNAGYGAVILDDLSTTLSEDVNSDGGGVFGIVARDAIASITDLSVPGVRPFSFVQDAPNGGSLVPGITYYLVVDSASPDEGPFSFLFGGPLDVCSEGDTAQVDGTLEEQFNGGIGQLLTGGVFVEASNESEANNLCAYEAVFGFSQPLGRFPSEGGEAIFSFRLLPDAEPAVHVLENPAGLDIYVIALQSNNVIQTTFGEIAIDAIPVALGRVALEGVGVLINPQPEDGPQRFVGFDGAPIDIQPFALRALVIEGFAGAEGTIRFAAFPAGGFFAGCNPADIDEDGAITFADVSALIAAFNAGDFQPIGFDGTPSADTNADGRVTFADIAAFVTAFNEGCP